MLHPSNLECFLSFTRCQELQTSSEKTESVPVCDMHWHHVVFDGAGTVGSGDTALEA
jgi:hypothetical protein